MFVVQENEIDYNMNVLGMSLKISETTKNCISEGCTLVEEVV